MAAADHGSALSKLLIYPLKVYLDGLALDLELAIAPVP